MALPAHADDEVPPVDEIFEYLETFDFSGPDLSFPQGISSIGSATGGDFQSTSNLTDGKSDVFIDDEEVIPGQLGDVEGVPPELIEEAINDLESMPLGAVAYLHVLRLFFGPLADFTNTDTAANSDPFLARRIEITNPFDEPTTFRFEAALEMVPLDPITAIGEGRFSAEVFDTGGDAGAELEFNLGHTLRQADSLEELSVQVDHSGTINEGELSTLDVDPITGFAVALEDFDRMLSSVFLTLSPGDTAVVTTIGSFGDATIPLNSLDDIEASLAVVVAVSDLLSVPEPSSAMLLLLGSLVTSRRRCC